VAFQKRKPKWDWRKYVTAEESLVVVEADREMARLKAELHAWKERKEPIRARASMRAIQAARRAWPA
jgi:hypothetical protein